MFNHQAINPAYTGSRGITNLTSVIRSQWVGIEGAPETQTITFGKSINSKNLGYGISVLNDKIGPTNSTSFDIDLAYHLKLNEKGNRLSLGLKGGFQNYSLNSNLIQTLAPGDNAFVLDNDRKILPNIFQSIKEILIGIIKLDFRLVQLSLLELLGIFSGILQI